MMPGRAKVRVEGGKAMEIRRSGSQPSGRGPAEYFSGTVRVDPLFDAHEPARVRAASVTFEPGARTACPDSAGLAACPEAMDCSNPRHSEAGAPKREHRGSRSRAYIRRSPGDRERRLGDHGAGGSLPGKPGANDWPLTGKRWFCASPVDAH